MFSLHLYSQTHSRVSVKSHWPIFSNCKKQKKKLFSFLYDHIRTTSSHASASLFFLSNSTSSFSRVYDDSRNIINIIMYTWFAFVFYIIFLSFNYSIPYCRANCFYFFFSFLFLVLHCVCSKEDYKPFSDFNLFRNFSVFRPVRLFIYFVILSFTTLASTRYHSRLDEKLFEVISGKKTVIKNWENS